MTGQRLKPARPKPKSRRYNGLDDFESQHPELGKLLRTRKHEFLDTMRGKIEAREHITQPMLDGLRKFLPSMRTLHPIPERFQPVTVTADVFGVHIDDHGRETFKWRSNSTGWHGRLEVENIGARDELLLRADKLEHAIPIVITGRVVWLPNDPTGFMIIKGSWIDAADVEPNELDELAYPFDETETGDPDELLNELGEPPPEPKGVRAKLAMSNGDFDWRAAIRKRGK